MTPPNKERTEDHRDRVSMERHLQTVIVVIIVGLLGWVGNTVQETQVAVAKLAVEIEYLKQEVQKPAVRFNEIESRLDALERHAGSHGHET